MKNNYLVDADETLLDFARSSRESLAAAMEAVSVPYREEMYAVYRTVNDSLWQRLERGEITKQRLHEERFRVFFEALEIEGDDRKAGEIYFSTLCRTGYLLPGAGEFLLALKGRGRVFLITNGTPEAQYGRLDSCGIRSLFDGIFISDEIGAAKPSPLFFGTVLKIAGAESRDCVVIGDSLTSDILGARNAGITSVWFNPHGFPADAVVPDFTARDYGGILAVLDAIAEQ